MYVVLHQKRVENLYVILHQSLKKSLCVNADPLEIKKIFDKLVVVKSDTGIDTKMGVDKPK